MNWKKLLLPNWYKIILIIIIFILSWVVESFIEGSTTLCIENHTGTPLTYMSYYNDLKAKDDPPCNFQTKKKKQ